MESLETYLQIALQAARAAGAIQLRNQGTNLEIDTKSNESDLVTRTDKECEAEIQRIILAKYPDHAFLGEETGSSISGSSSHRWIVDPLDGTVNYAHGFPFFCVSVALEIDGQVAVGVVYDPNRNETFTATKGGGAFMDDKPIRVSSVPTLKGGRTMLATGFPYDKSEALRMLEALKRFMDYGLPIRRPGAAALDLCYIACGRLDGFYESKLQAWDCAAANLIIQEAGGTVTNFRGEPYQYELEKKLIATNGHIHDEMMAVLRDL
jgi:myo-inositol-1(or 4)-monophosphatase